MLFQYVGLLVKPPFVFRARPAKFPRDWWYTDQPMLPVRGLVIIMVGATPRPCPIVPDPLDCDVYVTMLTPLVVFALTVEGMVPSVFATPAPFAVQFHAT